MIGIFYLQITQLQNINCCKKIFCAMQFAYILLSEVIRRPQALGNLNVVSTRPLLRLNTQMQSCESELLSGPYRNNFASTGELGKFSVSILGTGCFFFSYNKVLQKTQQKALNIYSRNRSRPCSFIEIASHFMSSFWTD